MPEYTNPADIPLLFILTGIFVVPVYYSISSFPSAPFVSSVRSLVNAIAWTAVGGAGVAAVGTGSLLYENLVGWWKGTLRGGAGSGGAGNSGRQGSGRRG